LKSKLFPASDTSARRGNITLLAKERGQLEKNLAKRNIKVEWVGPFPSHAPSLQAVVGGSADFGFGGSTTPGAEFPLEQGMPKSLCAEDDVWYKPYTDVNAEPEAMKGYFDWEFGLMERIRKDGDVEFSLVTQMRVPR
jgi:hypothetical protein